MKIKTSELRRTALDWAVAKCEGLDYFEPEVGPMEPDYSTDWSQGGPIIERERINLEPFKNIHGEQWSADGEWDGPTPLIAAMRCYVASKLGDIIDIPEELV
jgi:hypothetical protein